MLLKVSAEIIGMNVQVKWKKSGHILLGYLAVNDQPGDNTYGAGDADGKSVKP